MQTVDHMKYIYILVAALFISCTTSQVQNTNTRTSYAPEHLPEVTVSDNALPSIKIVASKQRVVETLVTYLTERGRNIERLHSDSQISVGYEQLTSGGWSHHLEVYYLAYDADSNIILTLKHTVNSTSVNEEIADNDKYLLALLKTNVYSTNAGYKEYLDRETRSSNTATPTSVGTQKDVNTSGDVHVKGYYRKDGTYVRPHTRSRPGSKKGK